MKFKAETWSVERSQASVRIIEIKKSLKRVSKVFNGAKISLGPMVCNFLEFLDG